MNQHERNDIALAEWLKIKNDPILGDLEALAPEERVEYIDQLLEAKGRLKYERGRLDEREDIKLRVQNIMDGEDRIDKDDWRRYYFYELRHLFKHLAKPQTNEKKRKDC